MKNILKHPDRSLYKWDKQIGEGAFGKVYAAVRKSDGLKVAIKELSRSKMTVSSEDVPLEVLILQQVRDIPGVATIQDWHETRDSFYIVMERCSGQDLFDYISMQGTLTEQVSRTVFRQVRPQLTGFFLLKVVSIIAKKINKTLNNYNKTSNIS